MIAKLLTKRIKAISAANTFHCFTFLFTVVRCLSEIKLSWVESLNAITSLQQLYESSQPGNDRGTRNVPLPLVTDWKKIVAVGTRAPRLPLGCLLFSTAGERSIDWYTDHARASFLTYLSCVHSRRTELNWTPVVNACIPMGVFTLEVGELN